MINNNPWAINVTYLIMVNWSNKIINNDGTWGVGVGLIAVRVVNVAVIRQSYQCLHLTEVLQPYRKCNGKGCKNVMVQFTVSCCFHT